jgi:UDP-perosamine 4-acetyltransferase
MTRVVGLGAGGHAKVVIEILQLVGGYEFEGLLDPQKELHGSKVGGVLVLGDDSLLSELHSRGVRDAFIGLGTVGDTRLREQLFNKARSSGFQIVSSVHPAANLSKSAKVGHGVTVMAGATINASAQLGDNVIVNTAAVVEHDCVIGNHVHIATGARLSGGVIVNDGAHIGLGALIKQKIVVGRSAIVGVGAVVVKNVPADVTVVGVPAEILGRAKR